MKDPLTRRCLRYLKQKAPEELTLHTELANAKNRYRAAKKELAAAEEALESWENLTK